MFGFFVKLPFKLALLPLRVARKAAQVLFAEDSTGQGSSYSPPRAAETKSPKPSSSEVEDGSPFEVQVTPGAILERLKAGEQMVFLDVRQAQELSVTGMIDGALHMPSQDLPRRMEELDRDSELVVYCAAGVRSLDAVMFLREKGFGKAWSLGGGLPLWEREGGTVIGV
jgi:rhodanese-related sulfurtransferase